MPTERDTNIVVPQVFVEGIYLGVSDLNESIVRGLICPDPEM